MIENQANNEKLRLWWLQVLEGDTIAFELIHHHLFEGLFNYSLKVVEDEALADDAVQELFIKIWTKREKIGSIEKVREYFFTVLRRQLLNQLRSLKLRQLKIKDLGEPNIEFSPEEVIIRNEEHSSIKEKILEILNELPKRQKEVIYLHYFQGIDYSQIALMMGINYQSVLNLAQKAMQKLRSVLLSLGSILPLIFFVKNF